MTRRGLWRVAIVLSMAVIMLTSEAILAQPPVRPSGRPPLGRKSLRPTRTVGTGHPRTGNSHCQRAIRPRVVTCTRNSSATPAIK